jgi:hypothetical protein
MEANMKLDKDTATIIEELTKPIVTSIAVGAAVAFAAALITELVVTNYKNNSLAGDKEVKATEDGAALNKSEVAGKETEGKLKQDKVAGANGDIKANQLEGKLSTGEATAAESGASALRSKAGASDIETKALKMT